MGPVHQDDLSIGDDAKILRRLNSDWIHEGKPEGSAFKQDPTPEAIGTSVTLWETDQDRVNVLRGWENLGLIVVTMGECRAIGLGIVRTPLPDNPNHCELFGPQARNGRRRLSKGARWVKYPDEYPPDLCGPLEGLGD